MKEQGSVKKKRTVKRAERKGAVGFEINPYYEQLLELKEKKPQAYRVMSMATHLAVEAYLKARDAASAHKTIRAAA